MTIFCWCDLSHVQYSFKDPWCSLACGHRSISGRRFSSPKWVERCDDRKYVCVRRLAVPKRHNFCSSSSSLATSSTCNYMYLLRLVDTIPRAPRASLFQILLSSLFKSNISLEIIVSKGRPISIETSPFFLVHHYNARLVSVVCLSTVKSVYAFKSHKFSQPYESFTAGPYMDCITRC